MFYNSPKYKHSKSAFFNGSGGAGDATTDSTSQAIAAVEAAAQAAASATAASSSATNAAASESAASASASTAQSAADSALSSASAASTSAIQAGSYVTQVTEQATAADASATAAATSASSALGYSDLAEDWAIKTSGAVAGGEYSAKYHANAAATSASDASTSASDAATSASDAATSASTASTAATNAAASYDSFDDRYLGAKSSAPSVDNDGNSLITGALYWDTVSEVMQVWDGSAWVDITQGAGGSGTVTSVAMSVPTGLSVSGSPITSSGTLAVTYSSGYAIPTTAKQTEWDTAYGWGNHASAGYLTTSTAATTYQPLDGDLTAIAALSGTSGLLKKTAANTYTLDTNTYLTSYTETDPVYSASAAANVTNTKISNWDTAYGWGNHASAGYLTTSSAASTYQPLDSDLTTIAGLTPTNGYVIQGNGTSWTAVAASSGSGDVVGPSSATDNAIARYDGTTGKLIQNSAVTIDDTTGSMTFTGSSARIRGAFGGVASTDVLFQNSTTNNATYIGTIPNGTSVGSGIVSWNNSNITNASYFASYITDTLSYINSTRIGSGSYLPIAFFTSDVEALRIRTDKGVVFAGAIDETVYAVVDAAGVALSPQNGTIQTWTLGASRTPTAGTWNAGESMTLMINDGTAYTVTWTTLAVTWVGGSAPTLATSGYTVVELWKVGSTIYGALVGSVA